MIIWKKPLDEAQYQGLVDAATQLAAVTEGLSKAKCPSCGGQHDINQELSVRCCLQEAQREVMMAIGSRTEPVD